MGGAWFAFAEALAIAARALSAWASRPALMASYRVRPLVPADASTMNDSVLGGARAVAAVPLEICASLGLARAFLLIVAANIAVSLVLWLWCRTETRRGGRSLTSCGLGTLLRDPAFTAPRGLRPERVSAPRLHCRLWIATWLRRRRMESGQWRADCQR